MNARSKTRRTGIDVVGNVPWGTHLCQFYDGRQDLIDILVPYFMQGLSDNECCIWVTSEPLSAREAKAALKAKVPELDSYLREGRIEILDYREWYSRSDGIYAEIALPVWVEKLENALANGYEGLRMSGNTFWLEPKDWSNFIAYEEAVNRVIGNYRMLAICSYSLSKCSAMDIIDVTSNHRGALVKRGGRWQIIENSELKDADAELRQSREDLDRAQAVGQIGWWRLDTCKNVLTWSPENHRIFGVPEGTPMSYEHFLSIAHPDDRQYVDTQWQAALRGEPYEIEHRILADGRIKWVREKAYLEFDSAGKLLGGFGVTQDISARKQMEEALREGEARLQQALGVSRSFTFEWLIATDKVLRSASCGIILGLSGDDAIRDTGEHYFQSVHPDDRDNFVQMLHNLTPAAPAYRTEYRVVRGDNSIVMLDEVGQASFGADGTLNRLVGVSTDITERKNAEDELEKARALLAEGQKIAHLGSFEYDAATHATVWSEEERRIYGIDLTGPAPSYDDMLRICIHPDDKTLLHKTFSKALETRAIYELEHRIVRPDGSVRWVYDRAHPYFDKRGDLVRYVGTTLDITERKALEHRSEYLARFPSENPNPVMRITADGILQYANAAATPVLRQWKSAVNQKVPPAWKKHIVNAINAGTATVRESAVGKDTYSFSIAPFPDKKYVNLYGTCITELKELHKREKLGTAASTALDTVEAMHEGIALIEMDGTVSSVNPALAKLTGYSRNKLQGHHLAELIPQLLAEKDAKFALDALETAMGGNVPLLNELTLVSKKGLRIPIMTRVAFIKDDSGSPSIIVLTIQDISRIVKASAAVEENKHRLEEAQRIAHIGNWDWNILEGSLTWSDEIFRIFGLEPQEFAPTFEAFMKTIHPDDRQLVQGSVDNALYENLPYSMDHRIKLPNGLERVVHEQAEVYRNETGQPIHMVGTVQDITARKLAEDRNRITASLLKLFQDKKTKQTYLDAVNEVVRNWCGCRCAGIRVLDSKSCIPYKSSLGFDPDFLVSENLISIKEAPCTCARVISGNPTPHEKDHMTPAGSFFCNDTACFFGSMSTDHKSIVRGLCIDKEFRTIAIIPIKHQGRTLAAFHLADEIEGKLPLEKIAFVENIAPLIGEAIRRFQIEKTLISSERRYRTLVENLPAITYTSNIDGTITYVSPQIERILGFSPADYAANHDIPRNQLHPDDRDRVFEELAKARLSVEPYTLEYRMLAHEGRTVWLRNHGAVVCDDAGKPSYIQGVMYDITEEKKAVAAVQSLAARLTLAEEEERKRLARALHDTINQTLALSKIKLGALNRLMIDDKAKNALQEIRDLFSKAVEQTRKLSFELSPPILYELGLREAVDWLGEKCREQYGFDFILSGQTDAGDIAEHIKILIFQSIRELLTNAGKHADANQVHVTLDHKDEALKVIVEDDGKGFDVKTAHMRAAERNSIGLFSTDDRMKHLGGTFGVESVPGKGTRITLTVPLKCNESITGD